MTELTIESTKLSEFSALEPLLGSSIHHPERHQQIAALREILGSPSIPPHVAREFRIWTAKRTGRVVGTEIGHLEIGRWASIWGPIVTSSEPPSTRQQLHQHAMADLQQQGIEFLQATLPRDDQDSTDSLLDLGFLLLARIQVLWLHLRPYREATPEANPDATPGQVPHADALLEPLSSQPLAPSPGSATPGEMGDPRDWQIAPLRPDQESELATVLEQTYVGSFDCPWLNRMRTVDEVMEGYRKAGLLTSDTVFLIRQDHEPVGCLLLGPSANVRHWHLHYWGLSPHVRGKGWGEPLVRWAAQAAAAGDAETLSLEVDQANVPALTIYLRVGFEPRVFRNVLVQAVGSKAERILGSLPRFSPNARKQHNP